MPESKPVSVIASFNKQGEILPIYIQIDATPIKLFEVTYCNRYVDHYYFRVTYVLYHYLTVGYLTYFFDSHAWILEDEKKQ